MKAGSILSSIELRRFGFNLGFGLSALGFIMFYRHREYFVWFSTAGSLALVLGILMPRALTPLKKFLDVLILSLGWTTKTITSVVSFYLIFAPIGILLRLFRKDPLNQKIDRLTSSCWVGHKKRPFTKESYERMG